METIAAPDQSRDRPVVAFDFDGTLTVRDSFVAFLRFDTPISAFAPASPHLLTAGFSYLIHKDRGRLKAAIMSRLWRGRPLEGLRRAAAAFAAREGARLFRPDARRCWDAWGGEGALRVIVTASPEPIVAPFADALGADLLVATRLETDAAGRLTGALLGANCRGEEKVRRLRARFGSEIALEAAYGDSDGDTAMLGLARKPGFRTFRGRP